MSSVPAPPSERVQVRRLPKRASFDSAVLHAILDEALVCHVGFDLEGQPYVIPTIYARVEETLYVTARRQRMLAPCGRGVPISDRDPGGRPGPGPVRSITR
jgi:nitroimidazol reductase NimA-like FMN-containing flavoprotein (pyridoxamine 5'-phosphate oxidase superfamily)